MPHLKADSRSVPPPPPGMSVDSWQGTALRQRHVCARACMRGWTDAAKLTEGETSLRYYCGSLGRTILSLWQAMSGGADWDRGWNF